MSPVPTLWRALRTRYLIALGLTLLLAVGGIVAANKIVDDRLAGIPRINGLRLADSGPVEGGNFLLIGSDSRQFVQNAQQAQAFGTPQQQGGQRSDTLKVVHVDPAARHGLIVSFPRDTIVEIPGHGRDKINAAFNDGPQKVIDTLKQNFGIDINHYVEVNFETFKEIVNTIGKVPVYFPAPERDQYSGLDIPVAPACVHLDGDQALAYVRSRAHLEIFNTQTHRWEPAGTGSDLERIPRQDNFIRRLAALAAKKAAGNPLTALELTDEIVPKLKMDAQLDRSNLFRLVNVFRKVDPNDPSSLDTITLPTTPNPRDPNTLLPKEPDADQVIARLRQFGGQPAKPSGVLTSQVRVRVLNASGQGGAAGAALAQLQQYAFAPAGIGNAVHLPATEVHYRPGTEVKARLVLSYLGGVGRLVPDPSIVDADVVVHIARDFRGVTPPAGSAAPASKGNAAATGTAAAASGTGTRGTGTSGTGKSTPPAPTPAPAC